MAGESRPGRGAGSAQSAQAGDGRDVFLSEILEQPQALRRAADALGQQVDAFSFGEHAGLRGRPLLLTGMGSSYHACLAAASAFGRRGVLAVTANTAELVHFQWKAAANAGVVVLISQSGRSVEVIRLAEKLASLMSRPRLIAITNGSDNPLAAMADVCLDTAAGEEVGPSTKSYAATFVTLAALVETRSRARGRQPAATVLARVAEAAHATADAAQRLLRAPDALAEDLFRWLDRRRMVTFLGRGVARGPLELAGPDLAVMLLSLEERTRHLDARLAAEMAHHDAAVLVVANGPGAVDGVRNVAIGRLDPLLASAVAVIPAQLLAWRQALAKGRQPGEFHVASKVTTKE
jgi:glutamine---fructose-6-phosphate transaminase (isomerizing)